MNITLSQIDDDSPAPLGREQVLAALVAALREPGCVGLSCGRHGPSGLGVAAVARHALSQMAAGNLVLRLRAESELAWRCSLLAAARDLGLPESEVRQADHPEAGVARTLAARQDAVVWIADVADPEACVDLQRRLPQVRWLVTGAPEVIGRCSPRTMVTLGPLPEASLRRIAQSLTPGGAAPRPWTDGVVRQWRGHPAAVRLAEAAVRLGASPDDLDDDPREATESPLLPAARLVWRVLGDRPEALWLALAGRLDSEQISASLLELGWRELRGQTPGLAHRAELVGAALVAAGLYDGFPREQCMSIAPAIQAALSATAPRELWQRAGSAWTASLPQWSTLAMTPERLALHADRLAESVLAAAVSESMQVALAGGARDLCAAVGATQRAAHWGRCAVQGEIAHSGAQSLATAAAWRRLSAVLRFGRQLQASRQASRAAEEILDQRPDTLIEDCLAVKCDIVEADLEDGRSERAFRRLSAMETLRSTAALDPLTEARLGFLRGAALLAGRRADLAEPVLHHVLAVRRSQLPEDHVDVLRTRTLLARTLFHARKHAEAERLLTEDLELRRQSQRVSPGERVVTAQALAELYYLQGRFDAAEQLFEEVLTIRRATLGDTDRLVGETAERLAALRSSRGNYRGAEPLFRLALGIVETTYGPHHPRVAAVLNELSQMLFAQSRYDQSRRILERALAIQQRSLRSSDPQLAETRNNLAAVYVARGDFDQGARLYEENLQAAEAAGRLEHPLTATTLNNLGDVYRSLGRLDEAERLLRRALELRERLFPRNHPTIAQSLSNLGYLDLTRGRYAEARKAVERALALRRQTLSPNHPHIANTLTTLARIVRRCGAGDNALMLLREAAEIYRQSLGERHQQYGAALTILGRLELRCGRRAQAELHLLRGRAILEETVGANHRLYAESLLGLSELAEADQRLAEAFPQYERALAILRQTLGADRFEVAESLMGIGRNLLRRERPEPALERLREADQILGGLPEVDRTLRLDVLRLRAQAELQSQAAEAAVETVRRGRALLGETVDCAKETASPADRRRLLELRHDLGLLEADAAISLGHLDAAERALAELLQATEAATTDATPALLPILGRLATVLELQDRLAEAEAVARRAVAVAERLYGRQHPETAPRLDQLAHLLMLQDRTAASEELLREVLDICETSFGSGHPAVADALQKYAGLLQRLNRDSDALQLQDRADAIQGRSSHVLDDIL